MTKEYVNEQLATHAQDTATSLGLAMAPYITQENGQAVAETMVNAIFDRGYYQTISVKDASGNTLIIRQNPNKIDTVPNWFTEAVHVTPPVKKTPNLTMVGQWQGNLPYKATQALRMKSYGIALPKVH